ncbi:MAG: hypothetical protein ACRD0K_29335, partial [Egibacteraceae bacterium]
LLPVSKLVGVAQFLDGRPSIGAGDLATARQTATHLASAYAATPNADAVRAAAAHADTLTDLLKRARMTEEVKTGLTAAASDAAALAGYGERNAGRLDQADGWFADALALARQAGDRGLEALALAGRAEGLLNRPDSDSAPAVSALEAAAQRYRYLPPAARAWVFGNLALGHAALGDDLASGRFLEHARAAASLIRYDGPGWGWWSTHGELAGWDGDVRPQVFTGVRSLWLGRPAGALELFDIALGGTTRPVRRALLHEDVTNACVALGDPDRACASAHAALDEAAAHELGRHREEIRGARWTFPKEWNRLRPVIELDDRLALAL